jgi:hypothetical protein
MRFRASAIPLADDLLARDGSYTRLIRAQRDGFVADAPEWAPPA